MKLGEFTDILQSQSHNHGHAMHKLKIRVYQGDVWIEVEPQNIEFDATLETITIKVK